MRRDHRPLWLKRTSAIWARFVAERYVHPQLDAVGEGCNFINPRYFQVNGPRVRIGPFAIVGDQTHVGEEAKVNHFVGLKNSRIPAYQVSENSLQFEELSIRMDRQPG